jgi:hypothetical protein
VKRLLIALAACVLLAMAGLGFAWAMGDNGPSLTPTQPLVTHVTSEGCSQAGCRVITTGEAP